MVHDPNARPPIRSGQVLVASPTLLDPNFREALVLLVEHTPEGSLGLIINRPLELKLKGVLKDQSVPDAVKDIPVYQGGPVESERLILAYFFEEPEGSAFHCRLVRDLEEGEALCGADEGWLCGYLGHSGWGEGQLDVEIKSEAWSVILPHQAMFNPKFCRGIWSTVRNGDTRWARIVPYLPDHPEYN